LRGVTAQSGHVVTVLPFPAPRAPRCSYSADAHGGTTSSIGSKLLSQVLKFVEGIAGGARNSVIFATNRPQELDPALLSRCAASVRFELPDAAQRAAIVKRYAKQLSDDDVGAVVARSDGMSGRDIKRAAEVAERRHAAALQRAGVTDPAAATPPPLAEYVAALEERAAGVLALQQEGEEQHHGGGGGGAAAAARRRNRSPLPRGKLPDDVRV
jgi:SpoVK/Ycf46/Vps4 family AAA+-type ATPase